MAKPANRPIRAEEKWAASKSPPGAAPRPERRAVHPSLSLRDSFSLVPGVLETQAVSQISDSPRDVHEILAPVPKVPGRHFQAWHPSATFVRLSAKLHKRQQLFAGAQARSPLSIRLLWRRFAGTIPALSGQSTASRVITLQAIADFGAADNPRGIAGPHESCPEATTNRLK